MKPALRLAGMILTVSVLSTASARAAEVAVSEGELELPDFYRAVACGADVGGACRSAIVKWPKAIRRNLRVFIHQPQPGFPEDKVKMAVAALRLGINEVNISGADIQIEIVADPAAPFHVHLVDAGWGDLVSGTGDPVIDGAKMQVTAGAIRLDPASGDIERASIAVSGSIAPEVVRAAVLKELVKALGLRVAISNPHYLRASVFTELGHGVFKIRRQDMLALRMHYPTGCAKASDCLD